eukprot:2913757-Rhodomonas_salina.2
MINSGGLTLKHCTVRKSPPAQLTEAGKCRCERTSAEEDKQYRGRKVQQPKTARKRSNFGQMSSFVLYPTSFSRKGSCACGSEGSSPFQTRLARDTKLQLSVSDYYQVSVAVTACVRVGIATARNTSVFESPEQYPGPQTAAKGELCPGLLGSRSRQRATFWAHSNP